MLEHADQAMNQLDAIEIRVDPVAATLDDFIRQVIQEAKDRDDFDRSLLAILVGHIVKEEPAEQAVAICSAQIEALAETRASALHQEPTDGGNND